MSSSSARGTSAIHSPRKVKDYRCKDSQLVGKTPLSFQVPFHWSAPSTKGFGILSFSSGPFFKSNCSDSKIVSKVHSLNLLPYYLLVREKSPIQKAVLAEVGA